MESDVFSISRSNIIEIINEKTEDKPFFKATIVDTQIDENGNEKELKYYNLVLRKGFKGGKHFDGTTPFTRFV